MDEFISGIIHSLNLFAQQNAVQNANASLYRCLYLFFHAQNLFVNLKSIREREKENESFVHFNFGFH